VSVQDRLPLAMVLPGAQQVGRSALDLRGREIDLEADLGGDRAGYAELPLDVLELSGDVLDPGPDRFHLALELLSLLAYLLEPALALLDLEPKGLDVVERLLRKRGARREKDHRKRCPEKRVGGATSHGPPEERLGGRRPDACFALAAGAHSSHRHTSRR
jgi:hypothetical protein